MPKRKNYIPCQEHWFGMFTKFDKPYWTPKKRFPISKIKIDKSYFADKNKIDYSVVLYMLVEFHKEAWMPITLNKKYHLLDGQHRLQVAKQLGLEYIDVVIEDEELLKT